MKNIRILVFGLAVLVFASCDKIEEATTVEVKTNLEVEIPVTGTASSMVTKSADAGNAVYAFTGYTDFSLADNKDLSKHIDNIKSIVAENEGASILLADAITGTLYTCKIKIGVSPNASQIILEGNTPINALAAGIYINYVAQSVWVPAAINYLNMNKTAKIRFEVSGTTSFPVNHKLRLKMPVVVKAGLL